MSNQLNKIEELEEKISSLRDSQEKIAKEIQDCESRIEVLKFADKAQHMAINDFF
jgi:hypothetical protein